MASRSDSDCGRKRKEESTDTGYDPTKRLKEDEECTLVDSSVNNLEHFACVHETVTDLTSTSSSHEATSDTHHELNGHPLTDTEGTLEDASINQPKNFSCVGETQEYTLQNGHSHQNDVNESQKSEQDDELCHMDTQEYSMDCGGDVPLPRKDVIEQRDKTVISEVNGKTSSDLDCVSSSRCEIERKCNSDDNISLMKLASVQRDAEIISSIIPGLDMEDVYEKVLNKRSEKYRVDLVTNELLEKGDLDGGIYQNETNTVSSSSNDDIFDEVAKILIHFPNADPSKVYDMLEKQSQNPQCMTCGVEQLSNTSSSDTSVSGNAVSVTSSEKSTDLFSDPSFKSNPLYKDLRTLKKVMPEKDPNELYAFLEAHFDKPNRVQIVIDELTKSESQESLPVSAESSVEHINKGKAPLSVEDKLQDDLKQLTDIFKDCDPNYLYEKLSGLAHDPDRVTSLAMELFEHKDYPKLKDILEKEKKTQIKNKMANMTFNLTDFLRKFPNPLTYFSDRERLVNQNYKTHVLVYLKNTYPFLKDSYINKVLDNTKHHLSLSVEEIDSVLEDIMDRPSKKKRSTPRPEVLDYPEDPEELFFQEILFCQHKQLIEVHVEEEKRLRDAKVESARDNGELLECGCCYDDECLFEDMQACADGHLFCKECIQRSSEAAIGEGKTKFLCLTGTCEQQFPLTVIQEVLPANTFSLALRKMQEEELRQADIPDLVSCPFCSFATIMPDPEDKVFKCLNQDCLRESCRLCMEPNHVPLRCNEVEKQGETNMRTFIETKMSEAMLRTCPRCNKRFYKEMGCNKMTCTCGESMCYICRAAGIDYSHFDQGKCSIDIDIFELHSKEMLDAAEQARQEYLDQHPEQSDDLKYDPVKLLEKMKKRWDGDGGYDDDEYDEYDDEGDEDYDD